MDKFEGVTQSQNFDKEDQFSILNLFSVATEKVLKQMTGIDAEINNFQRRHISCLSKDVIVEINVSGRWVGSCIFVLDSNTAFKLTSKMMGNMSVDDLEAEDMSSAISEFANISVGHALIELERQGIVAEMSPPIIKHNTDEQCQIVNCGEFSFCSFSTDVGEIEVGSFLVEGD